MELCKQQGHWPPVKQVAGLPLTTFLSPKEVTTQKWLSVVLSKAQGRPFPSFSPPPPPPPLRRERRAVQQLLQSRIPVTALNRQELRASPGGGGFSQGKSSPVVDSSKTNWNGASGPSAGIKRPFSDAPRAAGARAGAVFRPADGKLHRSHLGIG